MEILKEEADRGTGEEEKEKGEGEPTDLEVVVKEFDLNFCV